MTVVWQGDPPLPVLARLTPGRYQCDVYDVMRTVSYTHRPWLVSGPETWDHVATLHDARLLIADRLGDYAPGSPGLTEL